MSLITPQQLQDADWDALLFAIAAGTCIPMVGPDFVTVRNGDSRQPLLRSFADHLRQTVGPGEPLAEDAGLSEIAEAYSQKMGRNGLLARAQTFFRRQGVDDPALEALLTIPFPLVVSAIPGPQIEQVMPTEPTVDYYNYRHDRPELPSDWSRDEPLVYHLFGSVDDPNSLVYTDSDLLDYVVAIVSKSPGLPDNLANAFRDVSNSFLFLGFGLRHWHRRVLLHVMAAQLQRESASYALERLEGGLPADTGSVRHFYQKDHRVQFFDMEPAAFAHELSRRYAATPNQPPSPAVPDRAPILAFISHASEDAPRAASLARALESCGIPVWIDKEELRGGDRWDDAIEQTIRSDITHFIVLQSEALFGKLEGYVNKEIDLALDRERSFRSPLRFVIPGFLDGKEYALRELADIQSIDLRAEDGVRRLSDVLLKDSERRKRSNA